MGSHSKRQLELGHRFDGDSPEGPCQVILSGLDPANACGRPESAHKSSAYRPEIVHGEVVEPGTDVELARRQAREVEDSGGWHYQDRGNSIPWDIVIPGVLLILLWVGLCTYVVLRWKQLV